MKIPISWRALALTACAAWAPAAAAAETDGASAPLPAFGVGLDAGVPDFAGLNAVWRPLAPLRVHGGVLFNGVGAGLRGGVSLVPLHTFVSPTLTVEYGRYFASDTSAFLGSAGLPDSVTPVLRQLAYDFASAHLGLEVGPPDRFAFFLRAGLSYVHTTLAGSGEALEQAVGDPTLQMGDLRLRGVLPSVKLGFHIYFG